MCLYNGWEPSKCRGKMSKCFVLFLQNVRQKSLISAPATVWTLGPTWKWWVSVLLRLVQFIGWLCSPFPPSILPWPSTEPRRVREWECTNKKTRALPRTSCAPSPCHFLFEEWPLDQPGCSQSSSVVHVRSSVCFCEMFHLHLLHTRQRFWPQNVCLPHRNKLKKKPIDVFCDSPTK